MIKELNPANDEWAKIKVLKGFLYERPLYCIKGFLKIKENWKFRNVLSSCKVNDTVDRSNVLLGKSTFKEARFLIYLFFTQVTHLCTINHFRSTQQLVTVKNLSRSHLCPGLNAVTNFAIFHFSFKFNKFCDFSLNCTRYTKIRCLNDF